LSRDVAMRRLVQGDREYDRDCGEGDGLDLGFGERSCE